MGDLEASTTSDAPVNRVDNMEVSMIEDDDEVNLENMPSLSSYVAGWRFWWQFALFPAAFLIANAIAFVSLVSFDRYEFENRMIRRGRSDVMLSMFRTNSIMTAIILLVDTLLLYKAAVYMEKEISALDTEEDNGVTSILEGTGSAQQQGLEESLRHVHAKVSRKFEKFLGQTRRPRVTIFVSLLYVAAVLSCAGSLASFGVRVFASTSSADEHCSTASRRAKQESKAEPIKGLPDGLQSWAQGIVSHGVTESPADFIHLGDGRNFFSGHESENLTEYYYFGHSFGFPISNRILVSTTKDGSLERHLEIFNPRSLTVVNGDSTAPISFCGTYMKPIDIREIQRMHYGRVGSRAFCVSASDDLSRGVPNCTLGGENRDLRTWEIVLEAAMAYDGAFWYVAHWNHQKSNRFWRYHHWEDSRERIMEYYKVDPATMKRESVVNVTTEYREGDSPIIDDFPSSGACMRWFSGITSVIVAVVVFPSTYWLWKVKQLSAGVAPAVIGIVYIVNAFNEDFGYGLCSLAVLATTVCLLGRLPSWIDREAVVWAHYSVINFFLCLSFNDIYPGFLVFVGLVVGIILNHPVLQLGGWIGGTVFALRAIHEVYYGWGGVSEVIFTFPLAIIGGCGMVNAGKTLKKYRAYINYYTRRMWYAMHSAVGDRSNRRNTPNDSRAGGADLTRSLLE